MVDHFEKAVILWHAYKNRMGVTTKLKMHFNLAELVTKVDGLEALSAPFTQEEIDTMGKHLPIDRAPDLDGVSIDLFLKRCWSIVKEDFYTWCEKPNR